MRGTDDCEAPVGALDPVWALHSFCDVSGPTPNGPLGPLDDTVSQSHCTAQVECLFYMLVWQAHTMSMTAIGSTLAVAMDLGKPIADLPRVGADLACWG